MFFKNCKCLFRTKSYFTIALVVILKNLNHPIRLCKSWNKTCYCLALWPQKKMFPSGFLCKIEESSVQNLFSFQNSHLQIFAVITICFFTSIWFICNTKWCLSKLLTGGEHQFYEAVDFVSSANAWFGCGKTSLQGWDLLWVNGKSPTLFRWGKWNTWCLTVNMLGKPMCSHACIPRMHSARNDLK